MSISNGNGRFNPWALVNLLFTLLLGLLTWTARDQMQTVREQLRDLQGDSSRITVLETLQPVDRRILESIAIEQARQAKTISKIAQRLGVEEAR